MNKCPKCELGRMHGPRYEAGGWQSNRPESLVYRCGRCGYEERRPTADQRRAVIEFPSWMHGRTA